MHVGFIGLVGIVPASFPNFENNVKVKVLKNGNKGYKLTVRKKGTGQYFNPSDSESLKIKGGNYKLNAFFDTSGNFLDGSVEIKGKVEFSDGSKAKGTLMTATLGANNGLVIQPSPIPVTCLASIPSILSATRSLMTTWVVAVVLNDESVIIALQDGGFESHRKGL